MLADKKKRITATKAAAAAATVTATLIKIMEKKRKKGRQRKTKKKSITHTVNKWTHYEMFVLRYSPTFSGSIVLYISENMMIDQSSR